MKRDTGPRDVMFLGGLGDNMGIWSCPLYVREETHCPFNCESISIAGGEKIPLGPDWLQSGADGAKLLRKEGRKVILTEGSAFVIKGGAKH